MITNKVLPAHILRLYVWELLQQEIQLKKIPDNNGLVPIIPVEDEPKVATQNMPYLIYGYAESDTPYLDSIRDGVITFKVMAPTFAELGRIVNVISLAFESTDIATEALNRFSSDFSGGNLVGIRFLQAKATYADSGKAPDTEGEASGGLVTISYEFINNIETPVLNSVKGKGLWS